MMPRKRRYDAVRRIEVQLPPERAEEMEKAKGRRSWGEFVWELWEFWKAHHVNSS